MKFIRLGLTSNNASLLHKYVYVKGNSPLRISGYVLNSYEWQNEQLTHPIFSFETHKSLAISAKSGYLLIDGPIEQHIHKKTSLLSIEPKQGEIVLCNDQSGRHQRTYTGSLTVIAQGNNLRTILQCPLEDYVISVLNGEMPPSYHLEAIKAQAVSARTYALHPRVDHSKDFCDVCDSYLCCQAFAGWRPNINQVYVQASEATKGQVLTYKDKPVLALFSACAGGHTENYQDCFSDWTTGDFPPDPLPYLKGVSENIEASDSVIDESKLKQLWSDKTISTFDSWSPKFRWSINFSAQDLESVLHHRLAEMLKQKDFARFIESPPSMIFGNILNFSINKRGVGGTAIELDVSTSKGLWRIRKELTIRSLFKKTNLLRLPSAKIFFELTKNNRKQLLSLVIFGLGYGHGVGLQQVGAQGMAKLGRNYKQILSHYYLETDIATV